GRPRRPPPPPHRPRRYRGHAAVPRDRAAVPRTLRSGLHVERAAARRSDRRGATIAHAARRDPGRFSRRLVRLRFRDGHRRLPRSAPPPPLPEIPPALQRQSGLRSEEHTSELQSLTNLVCRLLLEK